MDRCPIAITRGGERNNRRHRHCFPTGTLELELCGAELEAQLTLILVAPLTDFSKELMVARCDRGPCSREFFRLRDNRQVVGGG